MSSFGGSQGGAVNARTARERTTAKIAQSRQRLASGMRINSAADDPAGLALATELEAQGAVYGVAEKELESGTSVFDLASSTVSAASNVLTAIRELAGRGASAGLTSAQRQALQAEVDGLVGEYNRVASSSSYNGKRLFSSDLNSVSTQGGDSSTDIVTADLTAMFSEVTGSGTFQTARSYTTAGGDIEHIAAADFNADGYADLVTTDASGATAYVGVRMNNGDGTFGAETTVGGGVDGYAWVGSGDIDGDGELDIIALRYTSGGSGRIVTARGNGDGTFQAVRSVAIAGVDPFSGTVGDINGDGRSDLVFSDSSSNNVLISLGQAGGTMSAPTSVASGTIDTEIALGDMNGDGALDLVVQSQGDSRLSVHLGNGNGTFQARVSYASTASSVVSLGDLNNDGALDAVLTDAASVVVRLGQGNGTFGSSYTLAVTVGGAVSIGDLNGDGNLDAIGADRTGGVMYVMTGDGTGSLSISNTFSTGATPEIPVLADFNNDGALDLSWINDSTSTFRVSLGTASSVSQSYGIQELESVNVLTRAAATTSSLFLSERARQLEVLQGRAQAGEVRFDNAATFAAIVSDDAAAAAEKILEVDVASETATLITEEIRSRAQQYAVKSHALEARRVLALLDEN